MSRPFSYNDENFTVIGNALFLHIKFEKSSPIKGKIAEIPTEIADRLLFYSNTAATCYKALRTESGNITLTVTYENNRYYIANNQPLDPAIGRILYSIYFLKDV